MKRIYRSQRDKKLFGVCGGLAEATGIDATIVRLVVVITTVFSGGAPIPIYLIAAMVMPKEESFPAPDSMHSQQHWGHHSWGNPSQPPRNDHYNGHTTQGVYPPNGSTTGSRIDEMMGDIEKKAMEKEIEQLKSRLAKYEKGEKGDE